MSAKLILKTTFALIIGTIIKLTERVLEYHYLTVAIGLIIIAISLLFTNSDSKINYSLSLPDSHWTGFQSKVSKDKNRFKVNGMLLFGCCILFIGLIFQ